MNNVASASLTNAQTQAPLQGGFSLNGIRVFPATGEAFLPSGVQTLEPKVMAVLLVLVRAMGQLVSAEQIFAEVWPRSIYSPIAVRRSVNQLRNLFDDMDKSLIRTHPKRGYALHASIEILVPVASTAPEILPCQTVTAGNTQTNIPSSPVLRRQLVGWVVLVMTACALGFWWLNSRPVDQSQRWQLTDLQPLTASAAEESFSLFTPDSSAVVYLKQSNQPGISSELWLATLDRRQQRLLYQSSQRIHFFAFAPALQTTASSPSAPGRTTEKHTALIIASEHHGNLQFSSLPIANSELSDQGVTAEVKPLQPDALFALANSSLHSPFFANNHQLYFLARQQGESRLFQADMATGQLSLLYAPTAQFSPYRIAPAPDPQQIALLGFDQQQRSQLKLLSTDSAELTDYQTLDTNWYFVAYHQANRGYLLSDGKALFYLNAAKHLNKLTFENYAFIHFPAIAPDGRHISYTQANISGNLFGLPLAGGEPQQLTSSSRHDWQGSYSPDQTKLAYVSNKNGYSQIFVQDLQTQQEQLVYANSDQQLALSQPVWSADGRQLAFARNQRLVILQLSASGAQPRHFDTVTGQPQQWLTQPTRVLLKQQAQPTTRWSLFDTASEQQQQLIASDQQQLFSGQQWYQADDRQLSAMRRAAAEPSSRMNTAPPQLDTSSTVLFQAGTNQRILQHFAKTEGIYLLLAEQRLPAQTAPTQASVWFVDAAGKQARKLADISLSGRDVSDITQQQLLYSTFNAEKDILTLRLSQH